MVTARIKVLMFTALVLGAFILKVPLAITRIHLTPDAIGYLNIAKNLSSGHGYVSTIKLHYIDNAEVVHGALSDCPPLYPLLAGGVMRCGGSLRTLMLVNTLLTCVASGLVFLIGMRLFDWRAGLIAGLAAALAPNLFRAGITAMSDPLALVLSLSALLIVLHEESWMNPTASPRRERKCSAFSREPQARIWFIGGILAGLAILTRYPCGIVALALMIYAFGGPNGRRNGFACVIGFLPAVALVVLAMPSVQGLHYSVRSFHSAMWNLGSPIDHWYCLHHPIFVAEAFLHNAAFYLTDLFTGMRGLFLLSLGLVLWLFRSRQAALTREHKLILIIAALNLLIYATTWSIPPVKGTRFLLLSYCLLLPFCTAGLVYIWDKWNQWGRLSVAAICAATALVYVWGCATAYSYSNSDCQPLAQKSVALIRTSLPRNAVIASNNPWVLSYSTDQPTALLPRNLDRPALARFLRRYAVKEIVLLGRCEDSRTAQTIHRSYPVMQHGHGIALYGIRARTRTSAD